jgi:hypothetical protein
MKGLLLLAKPKGESPLAKSSSKPSMMGKPEDGPEEEAEESEEGGSEVEFARLASEATASGDHDAAAKAIVSAIKACMRSYGGEE